jgi:hypothetical protein
MDNVRYSPLMKQYLEKVIPLAEKVQREDPTKSRLQLEREAALMIEYMEIIQLINRYEDGEGFWAILWRKIVGMWSDVRKRLGWSDTLHVV